MIFNSLGSNYNLNFVLKSLFFFAGRKEGEALRKYLSKRYDGRAILLYKGREAIKLALKIINLPPGSKVGVTGFTCYVVYQAIIEAGYTPVFIDIGKEELNFGLSELRKHKGLKVLIIQNTLGVGCNVEEIQAHCKENGIFLIEDLAHSIGTVYSNKKEAGGVGDFTALSFSQDKSVDAVSGGALIIRNKKFFGSVGSMGFANISFKQQVKDRFYPLLTFLIRKTYPSGIGKGLHYLFKKLNILSIPIIKTEAIDFHSLPYWHSGLVAYQYRNLDHLLKHRREIAEIYKRKIGKINGLVRYPILTEKRIELIKYLKSKGVFISDIWYDAPIAPKKMIHKTIYKNGTCPNSEEITDAVVNLPTHINISLRQAENLSELILKWQNIK